MAEVQAHGNYFENKVILERTGMTKEEYDKGKKNGYTSEFDLAEGYRVAYDASIKSKDGSHNTINCSDLNRMLSHKNYRLIVGLWEQITPTEKLFYTQYEFFIKEEDQQKLCGSVDLEKIRDYVYRIKNLPHGKEASFEYRKVKNEWKKEVQSDDCSYVINPKVDSKKQRRVQCSLNLVNLISSGIDYKKTDINILVPDSPARNNK